MTSPWTFTEESAAVGGTDQVTLVHGASFLICDRRGDISPGGVHGLFVGDTRALSELVVRLDGQPLEPLTVNGPSLAVTQIAERSADRSILVLRELSVGGGLHVALELRNLAGEPRSVELAVSLAADLADIFAVKEGRPVPPSAAGVVSGHDIAFGDPAGHRGTSVRAQPAPLASPEGFAWTAVLEGHGTWTADIDVTVVREGAPVKRQLPRTSEDSWREKLPRVTSDIAGLTACVQRAAQDLGALRIVDAEHPDDTVIAAGAPWFMTLFGRDSILTSWMALLLDPHIALSTARMLARLQGRNTNPETEEQPGRILHEVRFGHGPSLALEDGTVYYGSVDATPLFVMLVGELWRWGTSFADLAPLLPAVDAALEWVDGPGDPDGDGFVEYRRTSAAGLANQGWKDSWDGVSFAAGALPDPPIALAEVQAYAYAAWNAGAALAEASGASTLAATRRARAADLRVRFNDRFWLRERQAFALALDSAKAPVDAIASNMGHCLWTGIVDDDKAAAVARWLVSPELFSGWGVRTLANTMARYNPLSYHNGSVWPHDTAICIAGLQRVGFTAEAEHLGTALLAAATSAPDNRLPELFAGLTPKDVAVPVAYPASCSPQAWASAAPLLVLRSLLGLEPDLPGGQLRINPTLPTSATALRIENLPLPTGPITIDITAQGLTVQGLPSAISVIAPSKAVP